MRLASTLFLTLLFVAAIVTQNINTNVGYAQTAPNTPYYGNSNSYENKKDQFCKPKRAQQEEQMEMIIDFYSASAVLFGTLAIAASVVLTYKCMKKRSQRNQLKDQMQLIKHQFATQVGVSVLELNRNAGQTIHL